MEGMLSRGSGFKWLKAALVVAGSVALLVAILVWAGVPRPEMLPYFILGAVLLCGVLAGIGILGWHLLFRPLPAGQAARVRVERALTMTQRRSLAVMMAISGILVVVGGFWDEVWHRAYGLPFGKDLLWRPHLMLYAGFGMVAALAFAGLVYLMKRGRGSLQQRFRADPVVGLTVLVGAFLIYALPADPLWHTIYGADITAWSLPHIVLSVSFVMIMVLAAAIQVSTMPAWRWALITRARAGDLMIIMISAFMILVLLQVMVTEWDTGSPVVRTMRPEWLLAAVLAVAATFAGTFVTRATRLAGTATASGLLAIGIRLVLMQFFGYKEISAHPWVAMLPALAAIDAWTLVRVVRNGRGPAAWEAALAGLAGMALGGFPLINALFAYPHIGLANLPWHLVAGLAGSLGGAWLGTRVGEYLATANKAADEPERAAASLRLLPAASLIAVLAFITLFILTATPPVRG